MQAQRRPRRPAGTGSLLVRSDRAGRRSWYAKFRIGDRQVKRRLGPLREAGSAQGLSRGQAEKELRRLIEREGAAPTVARRIDLQAAADSHIDHVENFRGRKPTTVDDYRSMTRVHLVPFFGTRALGSIDVQLVESYISAKLRQGLARTTVRHQVMLLHGIFAHALRRGWCSSNPVAAAERPPAGGASPDIHYLDRAEVEALIRAVPDDDVGRMEAVLYLTAAMTGLRQGELVALRWRDVDWVAGAVPRLHARGVHGAEEPALLEGGADGRPPRRRARAPLRRLVVDCGR